MDFEDEKTEPGQRMGEAKSPSDRPTPGPSSDVLTMLLGDSTKSRIAHLVVYMLLALPTGGTIYGNTTTAGAVGDLEQQVEALDERFKALDERLEDLGQDLKTHREQQERRDRDMEQRIARLELLYELDRRGSGSLPADLP